MIQFMPRSFENGALDRQAINHGLVQSVRLVGEYRGKQALFKQQSPQVLEALRENAVIQSTDTAVDRSDPRAAGTRISEHWGFRWTIGGADGSGRGQKLDRSGQPIG